MGLKAIENGVIRFNNVKVPRENILWGEREGTQAGVDHAEHGAPDIAGEAWLAGARRCWRWRAPGRWRRVQWGAPIGKHEAVAQKIRDDGGEYLRHGEHLGAHGRAGRSGATMT